MRILVAALGLVAALASAPARADFVGDLGKCAKAPIAAVESSLEPEKALKAAKFVVEHGECIPRITGGDPTLYFMTGAIAGMQQMSPPLLPATADACVDQSIGAGSRFIADALVQAPGVSSLLSSEGQSLLKEIAEGQANATLYEVPGFSFVAQSVTCGCAVASEGLPIEEMKQQITKTLEGVEGCSGVVAGLLGGAYEAGKQAAKTISDATAKIYKSFKDGVNAFTCTFGYGCPKKPSGPPFFCVGYEGIRSGGASAESVLEQFGAIYKGLWSLSAKNPERDKEVDNWFANCEAGYQEKLREAARKLAEAEEEARLLKEIEKSEKLADSYALRFAFDWIPKCKKDAACEKGVSAIADQFGDDLVDPETIKKHGTFSAAAKAVYKKYSSNAGVAVALADERRRKAIKGARSAPAADRMWAYGCTSFLGRDKQSLCRDQAGFNVCKGHVDKGEWSLCALPGAKARFFAKGAVLSQSLKAAGCIPESQTRTSTVWQCLSAASRETCSAYKRGGSSLVCLHEREEFQRKSSDFLKKMQEQQQQQRQPAPPSEPPPATVPPARQPDPPPQRSPGA